MFATAIDASKGLLVEENLKGFFEVSTCRPAQATGISEKAK